MRNSFKTDLPRVTFQFAHSVVHIPCCHTYIPDKLTKILFFFNKMIILYYGSSGLSYYSAACVRKSPKM